MKINKTKTLSMSHINKRIQQLSLVTIAIFAMNYSVAQSDWKASVGAQFSLTQLNADSQTFNTNTEPGAGINLGISYALNDSWSIHSGVGLNYLESSSSISNYSDRVNAVDMEGESFEFRYQLNNYSEIQRNTVLSIPIAIQYESKGSSTRFYSKIGASANFFVGSKSNGKASELNTSGFYERFNGELTAPRFAGFGNFQNIEFAENDLELNNSFNLFFEIGIKESFGTDNWFYLGVFAEYGLNNILTNDRSSLVEYNSNTPLDFINNSSFNASRISTGSSLFENANLNIIGLRFKYEFGI